MSYKFNSVTIRTDNSEIGMAKIKELLLEDTDEICELGKAISSPVRLKILSLLVESNLNIGEIAKKMNLPQSSTAFHLKMLEKADLVRMEERPGNHGTMKVYSQKTDFANICFLPRNMDINETARMEMPVGAYVDCAVYPTCGLCAVDGVIGMEDKEYSFYMGGQISGRASVDFQRLCNVPFSESAPAEPASGEPEIQYGNLLRSAGVRGRVEVGYYHVGQRKRVRHVEKHRRLWFKAGTPDPQILAGRLYAVWHFSGLGDKVGRKLRELYKGIGY